jgi:hypothetical protein
MSGFESSTADLWEIFVSRSPMQLLEYNPAYSRDGNAGLLNQDHSEHIFHCSLR